MVRFNVKGDSGIDLPFIEVGRGASSSTWGFLGFSSGQLGLGARILLSRLQPVCRGLSGTRVHCQGGFVLWLGGIRASVVFGH